MSHHRAQPRPPLAAPVRPVRLLAACLVTAIVAVGCEARDVEQLGEPETPFVLVLSPSHAADDDARSQLADYLSEQTGMAVTVEAAESPENAITKVGSAWADAALLPVISYLFCVQEYGARAALQVIRSGDQRDYVGELLVRSGDEIDSLADLEGKRIAYVDPYSTTGFLLPAARLRREGIDVEHVFAGSHDEAVAELRAGEVDAAAVYRGAAGRDPGLRSIAETESIPNEPIVFRAGLDEALRTRVADALQAYAGTPEGRAVLGAMADITGFVPVGNEHYESVGGVLQAAGQSVEDLVPRGWLIHNENQLNAVDYAP